MSITDNGRVVLQPSSSYVEPSALHTATVDHTSSPRYVCPAPATSNPSSLSFNIHQEIHLLSNDKINIILYMYVKFRHVLGVFLYFHIHVRMYGGKRLNNVAQSNITQGNEL